MGNKEPCVTSQLNPPHIGGGAYWAGPAVVRPLFVPNGQALLLALFFASKLIFLVFHIEHL